MKITSSGKSRCRPNRFVTRRLGIDEGIQGNSKDGAAVASGIKADSRRSRGAAERGPEKMTGCNSQSSDDLTIILPRSGVAAWGSGSNRLRSWSPSSGPRSQSLAWDRGVQLEKWQCSARNRRWARWHVVGTMAVFGLVLATDLTTAARRASNPRVPDRDGIAVQVVEQPKSLQEAIPSLAAQSPISPICSLQTIHGTAVNFVATTTEAAREARKNNKLTFLLHISGNFEDADFT